MSILQESVFSLL